MVEGGVYENAWLYEGKPFTSDDIGDFFGFVYRITNTQNGRQYIGRKYFYQKRKPTGGKRRVTSESDWKRYYGSSDELKRDIKEFGKGIFRREIFHYILQRDGLTTKRPVNSSLTMF